MKMANTPKNSMMADGNDLLNFRPHFAKRFKMLRTSYKLTIIELSNLFKTISKTNDT